MKILSVRPQPAAPGAQRPTWAKVGSHSHMVRSQKITQAESTAHLMEWERRHGVRAIGMGSPWTAANARVYGHWEREERDRYFAGLLSDAEREEALGREDVEGSVRAANEAAAGEVLHYLDNETPKQRFGHMWHVGFQLQVPAWHDYDQDRRASYCDLDPVEDPNPLDPRGVHVRRTYSEIVARQRAAGAISVWAHPTSWWWWQEKFVTNIAAALPPNLYADGYLDGLTVQGYDAFHRDYQALWFELLDRGWRVPGFSELDYCPGCGGDGASLFSCIPGPDRAPTMEELLAAFRAARHSMSSGPYLALAVDGAPQGSELPSGAGAAHRAVVEAWPAPGEAALSRVELLGPGGAVLACAENFPGGTVAFDVEGDANGGWLVARAFGEHDGDYAAKRQQETKHCALTNPVRLLAPHTPRPAAVRTQVRLRAGSSAGTPLRLVAADGTELWSRALPAEGLDFDAAPTARLEIGRPGGVPPRVLPLAAANRRVRALMDYLADGLFLKDFPGREPGQVPVAAFRLDEFRTALETLELDA